MLFNHVLNVSVYYLMYLRQLVRKRRIIARMCLKMYPVTSQIL